MPAVYENFGVRFLYPENWTITDEVDDGWPCSVTVQSEETAFGRCMSIQPHTSSSPS